MIAKALSRGFSLGGSRSSGPDPSASTSTLHLDPAQVHRLTKQRARKFKALSTLFTLDVSHYRDAIEELTVPCEAFVDCPVAKGATRPAATEALAWVDNVGNVSGLYAEHVRLFGGQDMRKHMPQVAASGGLYAIGGPEEWDAELSDLYDLSGYEPRRDCPCPSYIANELEFMAHLLDQVSEGRADALSTARDFIVSHLYTWGIVFSAATHARSSHPVTRFAGLMLEHMLFCEAQHARVYGLSYSGIESREPA
jgi:TorA maturation chaperone TorD